MKDNEFNCSNIYCPARTHMSRREYKGEALRKGKELGFDDLGLDDGVHDIVVILMTNGNEIKPDKI